MRIKTPSRIHMTLIDLNASIGRIDGGIGLALEEPHILLEAEESGELEIEGPLSDKAKEAALKVLEAYRIDAGIRINIEKAYTPHIGLGSGTQISLAVGTAICRIYKKNFTIKGLARMVGRGGTSGIGVAAFEAGGFILDGGHSTKEKKDFLPSSASKAAPAPVILRRNFPNWDIALIIPRRRRRISGVREVNIFQEFCPLPINEVQGLCHLILMKILPALADEDIESFGDGINKIQNIGFKKIEVELQTKEVRELLKTCSEYSYGAGLSSFGPTIYCLVRDERKLLDAVGEKAEVIITKANNSGAKIGD
jgi:beta-ribofuranosylaminobenzene 5'-phosphate synthase